MSSGNFAILDSEFGEPNEVRQPRAARNTRGHHAYDPTIVNNKAVGYVAKPYDRDANEYPKMLYHPNYGKTQKPDLARFAVGAVTQEQIQNAGKAFDAAMQKWMRENRTQEATSPEHEARLVKKGWSVDPPKPKEAERFDLKSEEI